MLVPSLQQLLSAPFIDEETECKAFPMCMAHFAAPHPVKQKTDVNLIKMSLVFF